MSDEAFSMKRSRTQLATVYAPGAFFTFEGGLGACVAYPAARTRADLTQTLKNQIVDSINARVQSWDAQGRACHRTPGQPPVQPEFVLDTQFRRQNERPRLPADRIEFLLPDVMNYVPEPLTFVCRNCGLLKDFTNLNEFENRKGTLQEGCPHRMKGNACRANWEQLDVVLVHWSGSYHRISTLYNRWAKEKGEVVWGRMRCHCGNPHFLLDRSSPVFSKWRLICAACRSATELPIVKDEASLRVIGDGIAEGRNQLVEVNMEPISYRANSSYYVQGDRILAFANEEYFRLLLPQAGDDLKNFLAKTYAYPVQELSEQDIERVLREKNRASDWDTYRKHVEIADLMKSAGRQDLAATSLKAQQDLIETWRKDGLIPDVYQHTPELKRAVEMREFWDRRFDPIRQSAEHRTLEADVLNTDKAINVKEPKDPILPDLNSDEVGGTKKKIADLLLLLGIDDMRLIRKFPVCEFTFGYTRVESGPRVVRDKTGEKWEMPVKLNLFERAYFNEEYVQPIYVMKQDNEAFYVRLNEHAVRFWLDINHVPYVLPGESSRLGAALIDAYETVNPEGHGFSSWLDEYRSNPKPESRNLCSYVYTLLHTLAHQLMHSVAEVSGLELGSMAEHIFLPDLAFVIYRRGTTMDLGYLSSAWRMATNPVSGNLVLASMLDPATLRCGSGALCDERGGACPDCILIPEVSCLTRNNLLSRSVLRGMAKPHWDVVLGAQERLVGFYEVVRRMRLQGNQAAA